MAKSGNLRGYINGGFVTVVVEEILTLEEVAMYLKAGKRTVYRLAAEGKLPAFKLGGTWRFRRSDLDEWIAANLTNKDSGASN